MRRTAPITRDDAMASQANTWPRLSTFGQEMFTSSIATAGCPDSFWASSTYSSVCPPAMDTTTRAPWSCSQARSLAMNSSIPGPCRPIELSMPLGVSAMRGVGRPERGRVMIDFVTMPPSSATSKNWFSSRPAAAQPDAVRTGLARRERPEP